MKYFAACKMIQSDVLLFDDNEPENVKKYLVQK